MSISGCQSDNSLIAQATTAAAPLTARVDAVPPHAYFVGSAIFHYLGPAFAVLLFAQVDVLGVAWLRIASAALLFALWRRPWRKFVALDGHGRLLIIALGAVFAVMNACFYISIDRLPLATVAAIEFIGPIALALIAARWGDIRPLRRVAAGDGDRDRRCCAPPAADGRRPRRHLARDARRRPPPRGGLMDQVRLGNTGLHVSRVGLGMMSYGNDANRP